MRPIGCDNSEVGRIGDELLVVRCQLGEPDAFDELIGRWHGPLWHYIRRISGRDEDAQDILQDVWLRVIRGIARLRDESRFRGWLFGIARRALMDRFRRQYAEPLTADIDTESIAGEPDSSDHESDLEALDAALERLPLIEREILTLFYLRDLSLLEIADALSIPIGTVKSRLFRARRMAREALTKEVES